MGSLKTTSAYEFPLGNIVNTKASEMSLCLRWLPPPLPSSSASSRAARLWAERGAYRCSPTSCASLGARSGPTGRAHWPPHVPGRCYCSGGPACYQSPGESVTVNHVIYDGQSRACLPGSQTAGPSRVEGARLGRWATAGPGEASSRLSCARGGGRTGEPRTKASERGPCFRAQAADSGPPRLPGSWGFCW